MSTIKRPLIKSEAFFNLVIKAFLSAIRKILSAKPTRCADSEPNGFRSGNKGISISDREV